MLHFIRIVVLFLVLSSSTKGQVPVNMDSLEQLYEETKDSLEKVKILNRIAVTFRYSNAEKFLELTQQCFSLLQENNFREHGVLHFNLGGFFAERIDSTKAFSHFDTALIYFEKANFPLGKAEVYGHYGNTYLGYENYLKGISFIYKAITINKETGNKRGYAHNLLSLNHIAFFRKEYNDALKHAQQALILSKEINDPVLIATSDMAIGRTNIRLDLLDTALTNLQEAIPYLISLEDTIMLLRCYMDIGLIYKMQEDWKNANQFYEKALHLKEYLRNDTEKGSFYLNLAIMYYYSNKFNDAIQAYQKALSFGRSTGDIENTELALTGIAYSYRNLDSFELAYDYFEQAYGLKDSIFFILNQKQIQELEVKYDLEKKEQANITLTQERNLEKLNAARSQQITIAVLIVLILVLIISFLLFQKNKITSSSRTLQLKHQLLRNQMSPHFIFNSLIAIQSFVYRSDPKSAGKYLSSFAKLVRAILENSRSEHITIFKEVQWLENYLNLQLLRFENKFDYHIDIDPAIDLDSTLIPPMLTQPFIENALEHGLRNISYKGNLIITFKITDDNLLVCVEDNGIGLEKGKTAAASKEHDSLALKITQERLLYLNKKQQNKIYFNIESLPNNGTLVAFSIPFKQI